MPLHVSGVLINKLRKVYQVGADSLVYHDAWLTEHQVQLRSFIMALFTNTFLGWLS
jgi:hypothetical protein